MNTFKASLRASDSAIRSLASSTILKQAGWLAVTKVVQGLSSVLATLAIARRLGPAVFGELSLSIAVASFVATAAALGLEQIASRELATGDVAKSVKVIRRLRLGGAVTGTVLLILFSFSSQAQQFGVAPLLIVLSLLPLAQVGDVAEWRLIAAERSRSVAVVAIVVSPLAAIVRVALAFYGAGAVVFAWLLIAEWAVRSIVLTITSRSMRTTGASAAFLPRAMALLRDSLPLLMAGIAVFVYMRIDQFMIAAMLGTSQVGLYSAVVAIAEMPLVLPVLLLRAALPVLTRQSIADTALRDRTLASLMRSGFYLHALLAIVLAAFAVPIVVVLYGEPFRGAALAFRLQVLAAPFVALGVLSSAWLVLQNCTGHALRRTLIGAVTNIALNLLLIPRYGIAGAAAATLAAQMIATYAADAFYRQTRELFMMKTHALLPGLKGSP